MDEIYCEKQAVFVMQSALQSNKAYSKKVFYAMNRWHASWQLMDSFQRWLAGVRETKRQRMATAIAFQHLYLKLGRRSIAAWLAGIVYQQKVRFSMSVQSHGVPLLASTS